MEIAKYPDVKVSRKTKLTPFVYKSILESVSEGNWTTTAARSVGVDPRVVQRWVQVGRGEHPTRKAVEPFVTFAKEIDNALAKAEQSLVKDLRKEEDWRAKAWLLERGPSRDRWSQNVTISAQLAPAASILDALRSRAAATEEGEEIQPLQLSEAKEESNA
tara:strand:- start:689 stop:1171 length:483 start_codon:yes stop_codon:yes gene_type:complete